MLKLLHNNYQVSSQATQGTGDQERYVKRISKLVALLVMLTASAMCFGQETTGTIQGTIKDASGALLPGAKVTVTTPTLVGLKTVITDSKGYYHIENLPPGDYVITVQAKGFSTLKREGLTLQVGHTPTLDLVVAVGAADTVVDVTSQTPAIDVTSVTTQDNITQDIANFVPRGTSFQSVIQFAPAASNEPLMGNTMTNGTGSTSPGNGSNGSTFGYSIAGGADSENSYLVEGQETANLIGGYSHTSVPFDFIDQVEVSTSGIQAEHGGALGGVINVIMKKGSPQYHGSLFASFQDSSLNSAPNAYARYDPLGSFTPTSWGNIDAPYQNFLPKKPTTSDVYPGFTLGGPLLPFLPSLKDKLFFFVGFNPELNRYEEFLNYGPASAGNATTGVVPFSQNTNTYYTTARVDAQATKKIRVFGSWLYQLQRQNGQKLPLADSANGYNYTTGTGEYNGSVAAPLASYAHTLGYDAPNITVNTGADITISPSIVSTTRFGYYFENYHDFGFPTGGDIYSFQTSGVGGTTATGGTLPASYQEPTGYVSGAVVQLTAYNASKAIELSEAVSWYKSTAFGTHNFKFGYDLNRDSNLISQRNNEPIINVFTGGNAASVYSPQTTTGVTNCNNYLTAHPTYTAGCQGQYGYVTYYDSGTGGSAISYNHSIFAQDSWNVGRGVTIDAGIRVEHEFLPGEIEGYSSAVVPPDPINFGWDSKIQPRIGASWDVFRNGKMKVYSGYGVFDDQMKLNLAISSFGGQYWQNCSYANDNPSLTAITVQYNAAGHYCTGTTPAANAAAPTPPQTTFLENINFRAAAPTCTTCNPYEEAVAPNIKPYQQHEANFGVDYQLTKTVTVDARWDRRRLDHVIEDSSIFNPALGGETFVIVNPGQGVNSTYMGFCDFLYSTDPTPCISTSGLYPPPNEIPAARSYDGAEFRITKAMSNHWFGMVSYTYSHFRGNYTGLTSSDISDGGSGGRNSPNNSRAFDEPYFQFNANGGSSSGLLPTDRPNKIKGYGYYRLSYLHKLTTDFGVFQYFYQGSPNTSYVDVGASFDEFPVKPFNWGKWANITQNPTTGALTVGVPYTYRNPWYNQTDFNITEAFKISESKEINVQLTATNLLNDHSVTAVNEQIDTPYGANQYITPGGNNIGYFGGGGTAFYAAAESPYNVQQSLNGSTIGGQPSNNLGGPITLSSEYGKPLYYQQPRNLRVAVHFTF
jgi:hypothetical protein